MFSTKKDLYYSLVGIIRQLVNYERKHNLSTVTKVKIIATTINPLTGLQTEEKYQWPEK